MIGFISTDYEVGLYNAALKIQSLVLSLSTAITAVLVPRMSYYLHDGDQAKANSLIKKSFKVSMCLAVPVAVFIFIFIEDCLLLLFCGEEYSEAVSTLKILICCTFPRILTNLFRNQILIPSGNEKRYSQSVSIGVLINLGLNSILIPSIGASGTALGTLATECWNVFWMSGGAKDYRDMLLKDNSYWTYLIPLVISSISSIIISHLFSLILFWKLVVSAIIFFGIYYGILIIKKEPIIYPQIKSILSKICKYKV